MRSSWARTKRGVSAARISRRVRTSSPTETAFASTLHNCRRRRTHAPTSSTSSSSVSQRSETASERHPRFPARTPRSPAPRDHSCASTDSILCLVVKLDAGLEGGARGGPPRTQCGATTTREFGATLHRGVAGRPGACRGPPAHRRHRTGCDPRDQPRGRGGACRSHPQGASASAAVRLDPSLHPWLRPATRRRPGPSPLCPSLPPLTSFLLGFAPQVSALGPIATVIPDDRSRRSYWQARRLVQNLVRLRARDPSLCLSDDEVRASLPVPQ